MALTRTTLRSTSPAKALPGLLAVANYRERFADVTKRDFQVTFYATSQLMRSRVR